ncbi:hypothetical protein TNCV_1012181 [Trichonephila clavipes]|uniref:Uncharacterized protein n=1 Tax=Trichonephila clavipes TaxID=2585209 RepID=A0A8X7B9D6_TRICX|nr:hypothetical protein TNCV_1012181 [Trichonephila clavipes]
MFSREVVGRERRQKESVRPTGVRKKRNRAATCMVLKAAAKDRRNPTPFATMNFMGLDLFLMSITWDKQ